MMKTSDIKAALRRYYKPAEYALMFEVGNTTGAGVSRHADAVAMNLWPSRGLLIEGCEIKVSRSDWRRELDNPAKAEAIQRFCDQWWVVAPEGIVHEIEVPALWGLRTVGANLMVKTVKQAPKLSAEPPTKGFIAAMLRRASEADAQEVAALVARGIAAERAALTSEIERGVEQRSRQFTKFEDTIKAFKALGLDLTHPYSSPEDIAADYALGRKLRNTHAVTGLHHSAANLEKAAATLREVHEALSRASGNS